MGPWQCKIQKLKNLFFFSFFKPKSPFEHHYDSESPKSIYSSSSPRADQSPARVLILILKNVLLLM